MKVVLLVVCAFITLQGFSQEYENDTDQKTVLSVVVGVNTLKIAESDFFPQSSDSNTGYSLGIQYTIFPDYEYDKVLYRFGLEYSKEQAVSNRMFLFQNENVTSEINTSLINLNALVAYRFNTDAKIDAYLGGGFTGQALLNKTADAYRFVRTDGTSFQVFNENDESYPIRYQSNAPQFFLGFILEGGSYFSIQEKLASVVLGVQFISDIEFSRPVLQKNIFYLKVGCEIF
jgi:hypothetical protein